MTSAHPSARPGGEARSSGFAAVAYELRRITPRDRWLLELLAEHRVFTTQQIVDLAYSSHVRALTRLGQLHQRGVLDRFRRYTRPGSQSWRWTLGPLGAAIHAAAHDRPLPRPAATRETTARLAVTPRLDHQLGANGFFTALIATSRADPNRTTRLARWYGETRAAAYTAGTVRPDGHGIWGHSGRSAAFYLEYDTGSETLQRLLDKLAGYAHLTGTPKAHPVLFVLPTPAREQHLHERLDATPAPAGVTLATTTTGEDPAAPVWRAWPGQDPTRAYLADLPQPPAWPPAEPGPAPL